MARPTPIMQTAFVAGELSPTLAARVDQDKYHVGAQTLTNVYVHRHGGASNRSGFGFSHEALGDSWLVPFQYNTLQAYVLEFGEVTRGAGAEGCMRVLKDKAIVVEDTTAGTSIRSASYQWTASGSGTSEYYLQAAAGGDPGVDEPATVWENADGTPTRLTRNLLGSLGASEWGFGDNDDLGYNTIYVRLDDGADPDGEAAGHVVQYPYLPSGSEGTYQWTQSTADSNAYYLEAAGGGDPGIRQVLGLYIGATEYTKASLGSLSAAQWGWGDIDSLGYDTVYLRITGDTDPDAQTFGDVKLLRDRRIWCPYALSDAPDVDYVQSADTLFCAHPSYAPYKLVRTAHYNWEFSEMSFTPAVSAPTGLGGTWSGTGTQNYNADYKVSVVTTDGEESLPSSAATVNTVYPWPSDGKVALTWTAHASAAYYKVYKNYRGYYGFIGTASSNSFTDTYIEEDVSDTPQASQDPFSGSDNKPGAVGLFQQRLYYGRTNNQPQTVWATQTGLFYNMAASTPLQATDALEITLASQQVEEIKHFVPVGDLLVLTAEAEWRAESSSGEAIGPTNIALKSQGFQGTCHLQPLIVGNSLLFVSQDQKIVRDLYFSLDEQTYKGSDLTVLATHLFRNNTIRSWCYQKLPESIVWCARDDGTLLGFTYMRDHDIWAWHKHETDGNFRAVASIPESGTNTLYSVVKRYINGSYKYFIEYLTDRLAEGDIQQAKFLDSCLTYDAPISISGATQADPVVITATAHGLSDGDVVRISGVEGMAEINNNRYVVSNKAADTFELHDVGGSDVDGTSYTAYESGGYARKLVSSVSGLDHLNGESVTVFADGAVDDTEVTVADGQVSLQADAAIVTVGLPYTSVVQTLPPEPGGRTIQGQKVLVPSVTLRLQDTLGISAGPVSDNLVAVPFRTDEAFGEAVAPFTGDKKVVLKSKWQKTGEVYVQQSDPLPFTILAVIPQLVVSP